MIRHECRGEFKIYDAEHYTGSDCYIGYIDDAIITAGKFSGGGSANVKCVTAGTYKVTYTYTNATTRFISAIDEVSNYTVTEYAVKDGTVFASPMPTLKAASRFMTPIKIRPKRPSS